LQNNSSYLETVLDNIDAFRTEVLSSAEIPVTYVPEQRMVRVRDRVPPLPLSIIDDDEDLEQYLEEVTDKTSIREESPATGYLVCDAEVTIEDEPEALDLDFIAGAESLAIEFADKLDNLECGLALYLANNVEDTDGNLLPDSDARVDYIVKAMTDLEEFINQVRINSEINASQSKAATEYQDNLFLDKIVTPNVVIRAIGKLYDIGSTNILPTKTYSEDPVKSLGTNMLNAPYDLGVIMSDAAINAFDGLRKVENATIGKLDAVVAEYSTAVVDFVKESYAAQLVEDAVTAPMKLAYNAGSLFSRVKDAVQGYMYNNAKEKQPQGRLRGYEALAIGTAAGIAAAVGLTNYISQNQAEQPEVAGVIQTAPRTVDYATSAEALLGVGIDVNSTSGLEKKAQEAPETSSAPRQRKYRAQNAPEQPSYDNMEEVTTSVAPKTYVPVTVKPVVAEGLKFPAKPIADDTGDYGLELARQMSRKPLQSY